ncbi:FAD-dependent oxidoreductase [Mycolicibacterium mengxianglii]|uniref:FAD-dependent oxidoreductase n=1 Tax=Mycolicibacterium mengxianglii TaxID=2736649 RepID=UPI0018D1CCAF|nr:FAD-dependent oxidoreductase [Mycolicibacterium mengxianglii]
MPPYRPDEPNSDDHFDVVVVGGGAAGVAAASGAASAGARTLLLERTTALGGAATLRNVLGYCGLWTCEPVPRKAVGGVADDLLSTLHSLGAVSEMTVVGEGHWAVVFLDPEGLKHALDRLCREKGVEVRLGATLTGVGRRDDQLRALRYNDYAGSTTTITSEAVVDATGDATVAALGGAAVVIGAAGRTQTATMAVRYGGIDKAASVTPQSFGAAVTRAQQDGLADLTSSTGFVMRLPVSGDVVAYLADEDLDPLDASSYTAATQHGRVQAWAYLQILRTIPGCGSAYIVSTGPELGIRQSRHVVSRIPLSERALRNGTVDGDTVALAAWPSEYHGGSGQPTEWVTIGGNHAFGVSIDNLRSADTTNLFAAGRVLTGDRIAGAAVRVMGTALATGHAAGVAAALSIGPGSELTVRTRHELDRQGAVLHL